MSRLLLLVAVFAAVGAAIVPAAQATDQVTGTPNMRLHYELEGRFPQATSTFVNCPPGDKAGEGSRMCEFRVLSGGRIDKGHARLTPGNGLWRLTAFNVEPSLPRGWRRCPLPGGRIAPGAQSLRVYGVDCAEAQDRAWRIESFAKTRTDLRLPHHFRVNDPHTLTRGFTVTRFQCHGSTVVRPPVADGDDPYGEETAHCRTRFGDRFEYVFVIGN